MGRRRVDQPLQPRARRRRVTRPPRWRGRPGSGCGDAGRGSSRSARASASIHLPSDAEIFLPCSSQVYQVTLISEIWATSSRRRPGVRRRLAWQSSGRPTSTGRSRARCAREIGRQFRTAGRGRSLICHSSHRIDFPPQWAIGPQASSISNRTGGRGPIILAIISWPTNRAGTCLRCTESEQM